MQKKKKNYVTAPGFVMIFALLRGKNHAGTSPCTAGQNLFYSKNLQGFENLEGLGDLNCQKFFSPYFFALLPNARFCHDFCYRAKITPKPLGAPTYTRRLRTGL